MTITKRLFGAMVPAALALALMAGPALATDTKGHDKKDPPPPPKNGDACSPGYWKNHVEVWD